MDSYGELLFIRLLIMTGLGLIIAALFKLINYTKKDSNSEWKPRINIKETSFNSYDLLREHILSNANNVRYLYRADALSLANVEHRLYSFFYSILYLIAISLPIIVAFTEQNYWALIAIPFDILVILKPRNIKIEVIAALTALAIFIPGVFFHIVLCIFISRQTYEIWYFALTKKANGVLVKHEELFETLWDNTRIAIGVGQDVFYKKVQTDLDKESGKSTCSRCGSTLIEGASYCGVCGEPTGKPISVETEPIPETEENNDVESASSSTRDLSEHDIEQIRKWKALLDEGIITQKEFSQKKKDLLGI